MKGCRNSYIAKSKDKNCKESDVEQENGCRAVIARDNSNRDLHNTQQPIDYTFSRSIFGPDDCYHVVRPTVSQKSDAKTMCNTHGNNPKLFSYLFCSSYFSGGFFCCCCCALVPGTLALDLPTYLDSIAFGFSLSQCL